ncbi:MAG: ATP-binding cassette domain-containing protein [Eggerthellaceae bacterium]|nr:ATP-binding cassette domain-containing protein [Eggerthellaceae bacterium]
MVFWLLVWQIAAWAVGNHILLAGPLDAAMALAAGIITPAFWAAVGFSFARILAGFAIAFALALILGTASWKSALFRDVLHPLVTFMKSVPVVCIIVLLLVWTGAANVSVIAVALMVFPPVYFSYLEGLRQTSDDMRQMLSVFGVRAGWRVRYYYLSAVMPYVTSASKVVVGIAWKSGVAAEVIGIPTGSIGAGIYSAKIGLSTADLFAWTFAVVALSALCEKLFLKLLDFIASKSASLPRADGDAQETASAPTASIVFSNASFGYGGEPVICDFTKTFEAGRRYCLMGPSGSGKSTLMDLMCGFAEPTTGSVERPDKLSRDFQEDRLIPTLNAWGNVALVCPSLPNHERGLLKFDLDELLGEDSSKLAIEACSGGMKRKVALVRALAAPGDALLLDEPFAGLDDVSKTDVIALINRHLRNRTLIVATHDRNDPTYLNAELVRVP